MKYNYLYFKIIKQTYRLTRGETDESFVTGSRVVLETERSTLVEPNPLNTNK